MLTASQEAAIIYDHFLYCMALPKIYSKDTVDILVEMLVELMPTMDEGDFVAKIYIEFLKEMEK